MTKVKRYVQFGAGLCAPPRWANYDVSPSLRMQRLPLVGQALKVLKFGPAFPSNVRYGDIVRGLPEANGSCDGVYSSHTLEHLSFTDCERALRNVFAMLRPGGVFRFVVPDMERLARQYLSSDEADAVHAFMRDSYLGTNVRRRGLVALLARAYGNSAHLWMWDYKAMSAALSNAGFIGVRRAEHRDSGDELFDEVEAAGRWFNCLGVQCSRP